VGGVSIWSVFPHWVQGTGPRLLVAAAMSLSVRLFVGPFVVTKLCPAILSLSACFVLSLWLSLLPSPALLRSPALSPPATAESLSTPPLRHHALPDLISSLPPDLASAPAQPLPLSDSATHPSPLLPSSSPLSVLPNLSTSNTLTCPSPAQLTTVGVVACGKNFAENMLARCPVMREWVSVRGCGVVGVGAVVVDGDQKQMLSGDSACEGA
jgi:hypothetical protein